MLGTTHEPYRGGEHEHYSELVKLTSLRVCVTAKCSSDHHKQINKVGSFTSLCFVCLFFYSTYLLLISYYLSLSCMHTSDYSTTWKPGNTGWTQVKQWNMPRIHLLSDQLLVSSIKCLRVWNQTKHTRVSTAILINKILNEMPALYFPFVILV